jgi:hypothetical protein
MNYYSDDKETERFIAKIKYFLYIVVPLIAFIIFYTVIILKSFYPLTLSWEENKKLISYNNEVLIYEWEHQNQGAFSFYSERYKNNLSQYFNKENIQKRNQDRERDLEILKIGLKLYKKNKYEYPIAVNPEKIEWGTATQKKLKDFLYNVPSDPDPFDKISYHYQSLDGHSYIISIGFESFDDYGDLKYDIKNFTDK